MLKICQLINALPARLSRVTVGGRFIPEIDGLRFIAVFSVFALHLFPFVELKSLHSWAEEAVSSEFYLLIRAAAVGVPLFFVISGMILGLPFAAYHLEKTKAVSLKKYYLRRLTRLEPTYIINLVLLFIVLSILKQWNIVESLWHLLASLFYQHGYFYHQSSTINGGAWTLEIEIQFYILTPILTMLFAIPNKIFRRFSFICLYSILLWTRTHCSIWFLPFLSNGHYFIVGYLWADIYIVDWKRAPTKSVLWDYICFGSIILILFVRRYSILDPIIFSIGMLILCMAVFKGLYFNQLFRNRWITAIGGMCYTIYLYHPFVIASFGRVTRHFQIGNILWFNYLIQMLIIGLITLIVCILLFLLFEKPFMYPDWPMKAKTWFKSLL